MKKRSGKLAAAGILTAVIVLLHVSSAFAGQWKKDGTGWWFQTNDGGYLSNGLYTIEGKDYAFDSSGYMVENKWYKSPKSGKWYYALGSGELATSQWIEGKYYVGNDGSMMTNAWIDGYYVGADGAWDSSKDAENLSGRSSDLWSSAYYAEFNDLPDGTEGWSISSEDRNTSISNWKTWDSNYNNNSSGSSTDDGWDYENSSNPFHNRINYNEDTSAEEDITVTLSGGTN